MKRLVGVIILGAIGIFWLVSVFGAAVDSAAGR